MGRVKSKDRYITRSCGSVNRTNVDVLKKGRILKQMPNSNGYLRVPLSDSKTNRKERVSVHRLVAIHFIFLNNDKPHVNHIDFDHTNNCYNNLEWVTHQENMNHSKKAGRFIRTDEWIKNARKGQEKYRKKVIGINQKNGYIVIVNKLNSIKDYGFSPGEVCLSCKSKTKLSKGYKFDYIDTISAEEVGMLKR